MQRVAVLGLALTGTAVAWAMNARGISLTLGDNRITGDHQTLANEIGAVLIDMNNDGAVDALLDEVDTLMPAPGVPPSHPAIVAATQRGIAVRTEIDVAYEWEQNRVGGPRPILGVTGTDGKTTTTMITAHLLRENGFRVAEVGNTDLPFVAAVDSDVDVFVVECSSFRLRYTTQFRCDASVWLNFAPDHLDWHTDIHDYASAKEQMWKFVTYADVAVFPAGNELIAAAAQRSRARPMLRIAFKVSRWWRPMVPCVTSRICGVQCRMTSQTLSLQLRWSLNRALSLRQVWQRLSPILFQLITASSTSETSTEVPGSMIQRPRVHMLLSRLFVPLSPSC